MFSPAKTLGERQLREILAGLAIAIALLTAGCASAPGIAALASEASGLLGHGGSGVELVHFDNSTHNTYYCKCKPTPCPTPTAPTK